MNSSQMSAKEKLLLSLSLSPQSRASLAVYFSISPLQVFKKLTTFFKSLGVKAIYDTGCSQDITLIETLNEFINCYKQIHLNEDGKSTSLPMLSSACPGWICYAEKQLGSYILPYISSVKSLQQIIGATIRHYVCRKMGLRPDEVYHVTVMPYYDKKLEAARDEFVFKVDSSDLRITEVDSVLTSREVLDLIKVDGKTVLRFALCYGFQNLQNIVRKVKTRKCDYHFVEVMACPSGCLNGGGQIKPKPGQSPEDLIQLLESSYMDNVLIAYPFDNPLVKCLYDKWLEQPSSEIAKTYTHTEYHPVVKSITAHLHNWFAGVSVP